MNIPFVVLSIIVQYPLMIGFPIWLGWWIKRRFGIGWGVFGVGVLTFMASQVVHMPINMLLGLTPGDRGVALWPLPYMALVAGLSAALCENLTRWVVLRFFFKRVRGWSQALQFGAGHGAIESIFFGLLALGTLIKMIAMHTTGVENMQLTPDQLAEASASLQMYWAYPWYLPVLAGLERVFTITFHIGMAVLVMRSITRNQIGYLVAAIAAHTALDTWAVWGMQTVGLPGVEAGLFLFAAFALWLILRLRESPPPEPVPES